MKIPNKEMNKYLEASNDIEMLDQQKKDEIIKLIEDDIKLGIESYNKRISDSIHQKMERVKALLYSCYEFDDEIEIKDYRNDNAYVYMTVLYPYSENEYAYKKELSADKIFIKLLKDIKYSLEAMQYDIDTCIDEIGLKINEIERENKKT